MEFKNVCESILHIGRTGSKHHPEFMEGAAETNNPHGDIGDLDIPEELQVSPCGSPSPSGAGTFLSRSASY